MPYEFRSQPFKSFYLLFTLVKVAVKLPFWILGNAIPWTRPKSSWTLQRCLMTNVLREISNVLASVGVVSRLPDHTVVVPSQRCDGVWVYATPELMRGDVKKWATQTDVKAVNIPGYWYCKKGVAAAPSTRPISTIERIMLYLHGGAYIYDSAHPAGTTSKVTQGMVKKCSSVDRVLALEYRLARAEPFQPSHHFPAALIDAVAGYNYLVNELKCDPKNIVVAGDSAGANLAIQLIRYIIEGDIAELPLPRLLLLLSPWVDLSFEPIPPPDGSRSLVRNRRTDFVWEYCLCPEAGDLQAYHLRAISGPLGGSAALANVYISPVSALRQGRDVSFEGFPRTMIVGSAAEGLYDQIKDLNWKMTKDLGKSNVQYYEVADAIHDWLAFDWHEPERGETYRVIDDWITSA